MKDIVITTRWTDGDVNPFIKMGIALKKQGFKVRMVTHCYYEDTVKNAGLDFTAIDNRDEYDSLMFDMANYKDRSYDLSEIKAFRAKHENIEKTYKEVEQLSELCTENTVLIAKNRSEIASLLVSEAKNIPLLLCYMNPIEIGSMKEFEKVMGEELTQEANALRKRMGLPAIDNWFDWQMSPANKIALWERWYYQGNELDENNVIYVGFPNMNTNIHNAYDDSKLNQFFDNNTPKILVSGGTSRQLHEKFYPIAIEACEHLGYKAVVVTRYADKLPAQIPNDFLVQNEIPLNKYISKFDAIINHGGIGTVSEAIRSGVPQLVLGQDVDRPLNGSIVKRLGVGEYLPLLRWDIQNVSEALEKILQVSCKENCESFIDDIDCNGFETKIVDIINETKLSAVAFRQIKADKKTDLSKETVDKQLAKQKYLKALMRRSKTNDK